MKNSGASVYSGVVLAHNPSKESFLMGCYDATYPLELYRGHLNLLGGNREEEDLSPLSVVKREISEEFSPESLGVDSAQVKRIESVRDAILDNLRPYKDFISSVQSCLNGPRQTVNLFSSVYSSELPDELFKILELNRDKRFVNEGNVRLVQRSEIEQGDVSFAWDGCLKIADFLGIPIKPYENVKLCGTFSPIKENYSDYENSDFGMALARQQNVEGLLNGN